MEDETSRDIAKRNAGPETITVWKDGMWTRWGLRDAEIGALSEPDKVLLSIRLDTLEEVIFRPIAEKVAIAEWALLPPAAIRKLGS